MQWNEYEAIASAELKALLENGECDERRYQQLLERHPSLVPSSWGTFRAGHHSTFPVALIAQPVLSGLGAKRPSFLWIARDSLTTYAVLIEIESPCKDWFTKAGRPTADLTAAINQLKEWQIWFATDGNAARFLDEYRLTQDRDRALEQRYILVYGRRAEVEGTGNNAKRAALRKANEERMTWDRLSPDAELDEVMTVGIDKDGFFAKTVPPTITLSPMHAYERSLVRGKVEATASSMLIPEARRGFLIERWPYWDEWAEANRSYSGNLKDSE